MRFGVIIVIGLDSEYQVLQPEMPGKLRSEGPE